MWPNDSILYSTMSGTSLDMCKITMGESGDAFVKYPRYCSANVSCGKVCVWGGRGQPCPIRKLARPVAPTHRHGVLLDLHGRALLGLLVRRVLLARDVARACVGGVRVERGVSRV